MPEKNARSYCTMIRGMVRLSYPGAKVSVTGRRAGSGLSFGHGRHVCEPSSSRAGPRFFNPLRRASPRGAARGAVSQQSAGRRGKLAAAAGRAARGSGGRAGRPASPLPPGLGAQALTHSRAGPRPLGLLPPRGHQPPGEGAEPTASCFRRRDPEVILAPPPGPGPRNTKEKLGAPRVPKEGSESGWGGEARGATLAVSGKLVLSRPLASVWRYCAFSVVDFSNN